MQNHLECRLALSNSEERNTKLSIFNRSSGHKRYIAYLYQGNMAYSVCGLAQRWSHTMIFGRCQAAKP